MRESVNRVGARQLAMLAMAAGIGWCGVAQAQETAAETSTETQGRSMSMGTVGAHVDTTGFGVEYRFGLNRFIDLRAAYDFGSYSDTYDDDGTEYKAKLKISAPVGLIDIKPFAGGFRISAGVYGGAPELKLKSKGQDDYDVGESTYTGDLSMKGKADLGSAAPYLGIGWGGTTNGTGFGVSFDMGVMFTKAPNVSLDATGRVCDSTNGACDPNGAEGFDIESSNDPRVAQFMDDLQQEVSDIEDDTKDFKFWPVLALGFVYRF